MRLYELCIVLGSALIAQADEAEDLCELSYTVNKVEKLPKVEDAWESAVWRQAETLSIDTFHPLGSDHRPKTQARLLHDGTSLAVMFRVEDQYVVAHHTEYQQPTHEDSCVEFFAQPRTGKGYFNFEMNAAGTLLLWYVEDPRRIGGKFAKYTPVPLDLFQKIDVHTSLSGPIDTEIADPVTWTVSYRIPITLFEFFTGDLTNFSKQKWRGNFYKCADKSSHPHWGYWAGIGDRLDFHQPGRFAPIVFE
ncbi:MAG: carbohydrate-binding family 9-like protein [Candidatus Hydrogenedentes bacterium]|nr:carbohydrate-binding family 9-like protein [Candidatus Hydrogenedentota bacterium]